MFALEIDFHDGVSPPEVLLVRRPHALVGGSEFSHVIIEGAASSMNDFRLARGLGRQFRCKPVSKSQNVLGSINFSEQYEGFGELKFESVTTRVTALDIDLRTMPDESPDKAGVRVLRKALSTKAPLFPAIAVLGSIPLFISFPSDQPLIVGRSRKCSLRLDSNDVSSEHARIGFDGTAFWVEDLGSTNGTFVGSERVAGRRTLSAGETISIGSEYVLQGISNEKDVPDFEQNKTDESAVRNAVNSQPSIVSASDLVRPARFQMKVGRKISIGRDPANDIWVGAAHISRLHAELECDEKGRVFLLDLSSNGTFYQGKQLVEGDPVELEDSPAIIDLGEGIEIAVCHSPNEEELFFGELESPKPMLEMPENLMLGEETPKSLPSVSDAEVDFGVDDTGLLQIDSADYGEHEDFDTDPSSVFQQLAQRQKTIGEDLDDKRWLDYAPEGFVEAPISMESPSADFENEEVDGIFKSTSRIGKVWYGFNLFAVFVLILGAVGVLLFNSIFSG